MSASSPLRHVVIGCGALVFAMHRPGLQSENVKVVGLCDLKPECKSIAEEFNAPFYTDYRQMLAETRPDVAVITTPHYNHAQIALDCFRAGCHVLVEKPIALHVKDADAMVAAARQAGKLLAVNFQHRHRPEIIAARKLIQEGKLGTLQRLTMVIPWPRSDRYYSMGSWRATWWGEGGGVLMNQAPHDLDLVCHLMGKPRRVVSWNRTQLHPIEVEDTTTSMLEFENGATGFLHVTTAEGGPKNDVEIVGTGGVLRIGFGSLSFEQFDEDVYEFLRTTDELWRGPYSKQVPVELPDSKGEHASVYRNFHRAILEGAPIAADGTQGVNSLELANAIILSSQTGKEVSLPIDREVYAALLEDLISRSKNPRGH